MLTILRYVVVFEHNGGVRDTASWCLGFLGVAFCEGTQLCVCKHL